MCSCTADIFGVITNWIEDKDKVLIAERPLVIFVQRNTTNSTSLSRGTSYRCDILPKISNDKWRAEESKGRIEGGELRKGGKG